MASIEAGQQPKRYPLSEDTLELIDGAQIFQLAKVAVKRMRVELNALLPHVRIFHVGSTALDSGVTKGDIDLQLLCQKSRFDRCRQKLAHIYPVNRGAFQVSQGGQSFDAKTPRFDVGLHLTIENSEADFQRYHTEVLREDAELRRQYFELKHQWNGHNMDAYRDAKAQFFSRPEFRG